MATSVAAMTPVDRIAAAMERSIPKLPGDLADGLRRLLTPQNLAIMAGVLVAWVASHAFGIGEIVDVLLLGVGIFTLGWSVFSGAEHLMDFATTAVNASTDAELDRAADHFAKAVVILGIAAIQAFLLRGQARQVSIAHAEGRIAIRGPVRVGDPPPAGRKLDVSRPMTGREAGGSTTAYGKIVVGRGQSMSEQRITLWHELVHRFLSPKVGPLRRLRAQAHMGGYSRVSLLRYLEEALAEGFGQLKVHGLLAGLKAYSFPVANNYVTISQMAGEGSMIGTILLAGTRYHVSVTAHRQEGEVIELKDVPPLPGASPRR